MDHKNSRKVTIFRAGSFLSRAQGKEVEEFLSTTKRSIGSYWESTSSRRIASGLSFSEEAILLPLLLDVPAEDREFRKKVSTFYVELDTPVPHGQGRVLEIGFESSNTAELSAKNLPLNLMDYLRYRHAIKHPNVAATKEDADGNMSKEFYIFDKSDVVKKNTKTADEKDAAMQIYLEIKNDTVQVDGILTLLETDPREFTGSDAAALKQEALRNLSETKPADFVKVFNEADLTIRYWIKTMVNTGVFKLIGAKYLDGETNKLIANNLEETIFFFKDEENSESVSLYKTRMQEAVKKPIATKRR
jgi:hypothetical protein